MKKIRIGNDFTITRTVVSGDSPEDLVNVSNPKLELISYFAVPTVNPSYTISDVNKIDVSIETQYVPKVGKYKLVFSYDVPEVGFGDGFRKVTIDIANFEIVSESSKADDCNDVAAAGQIEIGIKGDSAFRVWLGEAGNAGKTKEDYFNWLQEPATEAVEGANSAAQAANAATILANTAAEYANTQGDYAKGIGEGVAANETIRIGAENIRLQNEIDRINAEALRDSSETSRINAEGLRDSAESSRRSAEVLREQAKADTIEATENANTATGLTIAAKDDYYNVVKPEIIAQGEYATAQGDYAKAQGEAVEGAITDLQADLLEVKKEDTERTFKTLSTGAAGLITFSPTTRYFTYKLNILDNVIINVDLQRMISQIGNARCRLIIDMPILKTITFTKPILWGGIAPTFSSAGQYILEVIDVDGSGTPLMWQVAYTGKAQPTNNILYVNGSAADYTVGQINAGTPTRLTSSWANPFKYLQNAINAATAGDVIFVKAGTLYPTHLNATPTTYVNGDHLSKNATFTMKTGVDVYGGFLGTETKSWQRKVDSKGYPINKTILSGDVKREAVIAPSITVGDRRTSISKANAAKGVVYANVGSYTYFNGFEVIYGNSDSNGGGILSTNTNFVGINNVSRDNTANYGGGWHSGTNTNCTAYSNTANYGGGWNNSTNTNCTAYSNIANTYGGGWHIGTNTNCTAYSNTAGVSGGGWYLGTNTNCTAYSNTAGVSGGGWHSGTNSNCTAYSNIANNGGGGWYLGTNTNCTAYSNTANNGGGWIYGTNTNCTSINNKAPQAVYQNPTTTDTNINCLLFNNKNNANVTVGFNDVAATSVKVFRNNAYDTPHPTITGGAGSDINFTTCLQNVTQAQIKIEVPSVIGAATNEIELNELHEFAANILTNLKPKSGSILKGVGINNATYPNPTDFENNARPENSTIGILEGE